MALASMRGSSVLSVNSPLEHSPAHKVMRQQFAIAPMLESPRRGRSGSDHLKAMEIRAQLHKQQEEEVVLAFPLLSLLDCRGLLSLSASQARLSLPLLLTPSWLHCFCFQAFRRAQAEADACKRREQALAAERKRKEEEAGRQRKRDKQEKYKAEGERRRQEELRAKTKDLMSALIETEDSEVKVEGGGGLFAQTSPRSKHTSDLFGDGPAAPSSTTAADPATRSRANTSGLSGDEKGKEGVFASITGRLWGSSKSGPHSAPPSTRGTPPSAWGDEEEQEDGQGDQAPDLLQLSPSGQVQADSAESQKLVEVAL
ncbi:unnamed protein product [Chrysoparadoxa australica]